MRYLCLKIGSATITFLVVALCFPRVSAKEFNYLCFIQTTSGKIVDLSSTICQSEKRKRKKSINLNRGSTHQTLMEAYKRRKGRRRY